MRKLILVTAAAIAFAAAASAQTSPPPATPAPAAVAPPPAAAAPAPTSVTDVTPHFVNIVELEISPSSMAKFMPDLADDVKGTLTEAGVREIDSNVGQKDPGHVFIFEVYDNSAVWNSPCSYRTPWNHRSWELTIRAQQKLRRLSSL